MTSGYSVEPATIYISSSAGRAYVVDADCVFTIRAGRPDIVAADASQLNNFFGFYSDLVVRREHYPYESAREELETTTHQARCLNFVLEVVDITAAHELRLLAARAADSLLAQQTTREAVTDALLNAISPADASYDAAIDLASANALEHLRDVCAEVVMKAQVIKKLRLSWDAMLAGISDHELRRDTYQFAARTRVIGRMIRLGASTVLQELRELTAEASFARVHGVVWAWVSTNAAPSETGSQHGILCDDVRRVAYFFLDGELSEMKTNKILHHLALCPDCEQRIVLHRRLRNLVRKRLPRLSAPQSLKERLVGPRRSVTH